MNMPAAIYAHVSSDRQKENHTIASQTARRGRETAGRTELQYVGSPSISAFCIRFESELRLLHGL